MKLITKLGALSALFSMAIGANATMIQANYTVHTNQGSGLKVNESDIANNPFQLNLNAGESQTFKLFGLYTDETSVNWDDQQPQPIKADFTFLQPASGSTTVNGNTVGQKFGFFGNFQQGHVSWDGPASFKFGPNNDGLLQIALSDADFNKGFLFGTAPGKCWGAAIKATFNLISDATPADVPEPSAAALFALALIGLGFTAYRRRKSRI